MPSLSYVVPFFGLLFSLYTVLKFPVAKRTTVFGITGRPRAQITNVHGEGLEVVPDTYFAEDIHYHAPSDTLFGVSEPHPHSRNNWFPPSEHFSLPDLIGQGSIFTLNPTTNQMTRLNLQNFKDAPFVTHGIDIYNPPAEEETLYIFAVNHLPNPDHYGTSLAPNEAKKTPKARSQIDIFKHTLGTNDATYIRSIHHPLIRTPNDIYIENEHSFFVTNDHYHREGRMRMYEDMGWSELAAWSDIIHISNIDLAARLNPAAGFDATVALDRIHNPNGFGHGKTDDEIMCARAGAGVLELMQLAPPPPPSTSPSSSSSSSLSPPGAKNLTSRETIQLSVTVDNPSYFHDPYVKATGRDASGYVMAGLLKAWDFPDAEHNPTGVWLIDWASREQKLIFQDDGRVLNTTSTGVIVAIDPAGNEGRKQGWLFVTGPFSESLVRTKIDL